MTTPNITTRQQTLEFERLEFEKYLGFTALREWLLVRRHLQFAQGFSLIVVLTPHREAAEACARDLERILELESLNLTRVPIESPKELRQLPVWLFKHAQQSKSGAIWVDGVPPSTRPDVLERWKESWVASLSRLNEQRDAMAKRFSTPLILVAPSWLKTLMHEVAADLWSVRSLVVDVIPAPPSLLEFSNAIIERDITNTGSSLDPEFALERAKRIENEPTKVEEYLTLLARAAQGFMDRRLWVDAERLLREMLKRVKRPEQHGAVLRNLSISVSAQSISNYQKALEMSEGAVKIYRELNLKSQDAFLADLAISLNTHSVSQSDLGDQQAALETINEAVQIIRKLVLRNRDTFLQSLATSLNNQSNRYSSLGDYKTALEIMSEVIQILRELVSKDRDAFLSDLAGSLNNQSNIHSHLGNYETALEIINEAIKILRELVSKDRDAFLPDLALSLHNQSNCQINLGNYETALEIINEALKIRRKLVSENLQVFTPDLTTSYGTQGLILNAKNQFIEARESFAEGLRLLISFAKQIPEVFKRLATSLMRGYISNSRAAGREPDADLLKPFQAIYGISGEDNQIQQILEKSEPLLQGIAHVASDNTAPRVEIEKSLTTLEDNGFHISASIQRIWAGERNSSTLTNGLDAQDSAIIHRILEIIQNPDQT